MRIDSFTLQAALLSLGLTTTGCQLLIDPDKGDIGTAKGAAGASEQPGNCAGVRCESGDHCESSGGGAKCVADTNDGGTCDLACGAGEHCELIEVQCVTEPCLPVAQCVADVDPALTCASVLCLTGTVCIETDQGPQCLPREENPCNLVDCRPDSMCQVVNGEAQCVPVETSPGQCAATLCGPNTYCDDTSGDARCLPLPTCDGVSCGAGEHCELVEVTCVRAPCPPQPSCVPESPCALLDCQPDKICQVVGGEATCVSKEPCADVSCKNGTHCELVDVQCKRAPCNPVTQCVPDAPDPCEGVRCKDGTHCEAVEIVCVTTPCDPIAECVPDEETVRCGRSLCIEGYVCCNESCGICAPPGGGCTDQFCS